MKKYLTEAARAGFALANEAREPGCSDPRPPQVLLSLCSEEHEAELCVPRAQSTCPHSVSAEASINTQGALSSPRFQA